MMMTMMVTGHEYIWGTVGGAGRRRWGKKRILRGDEYKNMLHIYIRQPQETHQTLF
jgi:hypothetical protein